VGGEEGAGKGFDELPGAPAGDVLAVTDDLILDATDP
jgi:hypothetical protein